MERALQIHSRTQASGPWSWQVPPAEDVPATQQPASELDWTAWPRHQLGMGTALPATGVHLGQGTVLGTGHAGEI